MYALGPNSPKLYGCHPGAGVLHRTQLSPACADPAFSGAKPGQTESILMVTLVLYDFYPRFGQIWLPKSYQTGKGGVQGTLWSGCAPGEVTTTRTARTVVIGVAEPQASHGDGSFVSACQKRNFVNLYNDAFL